MHVDAILISILKYCLIVELFEMWRSALPPPPVARFSWATHLGVWRLNLSGFGSGSYYFSSFPSRCQQKICFFRFFWLINYPRYTFTSVLKDNSLLYLEVAILYKSRFFLIFFCLLKEGSGSGSVQISADPEHCR
jgi:hypothetical protein